ncbi:helix-turn-helix domain-containing protein [Flindersiella endophytica]
MTDETYGATIAKRRLSRRLAELRVENGYTANQVCDRLNWGRGKVGRFEANGWVRPEMSDIRDLLRIYGVSDEEQKQLEDLAMLARARAWWRDYADVVESEVHGYEADAARISTYLPLVIPGLLQTPAYMEAQLRVGPRSSAWRNRAVGVRLRRQAILDRTDGTAPELVAVITEASLRYQWGAQSDRRAQVAHLVEMSRRPNVELRLLRFQDGPHPGMTSAISIYDFPGDEPSMVFLETELSIEEVDKTDEVGTYTDTYEKIRDAALDPAATTAALKQLAETLE